MKVTVTDETYVPPTSTTEGLWHYNALDCCITMEVFEAIAPQLDNLTTSTYEFSKALQGPALEMKLRGIRVDEEYRWKAIRAYEEELNVLRRQLSEIVREGVGWTEPFNPASPAQVGHLLYNVLGLPTVRKRGKPTTDRDALERLSSYFIAEPIVRHLLAIRDISKKVSTLKSEIDADGRYRTSYNIAGTSTGRFSSSFNDLGTGGNAQNWEERLRRIFIADPGMKFAYIDLEQAESRAVGAIIWNLFNDSRYLDACESGDLHTYVARLSWPELDWDDSRPGWNREVAERPFYRHHSYRHMAKVLGHGCLTTDHEVLTSSGWVPITDKPTHIVAWSEGHSSFSTVSHWEDKPYTGTLHQFDGNSISANMTHDHRVPYRADSRYGKVQERPAEAGPQTLMPLGGGYIGGTDIVPARLIAAFMADGHQKSPSQVEFHFKKDRKKQRLRQLCQQYGYEFQENEDKIRLYESSFPKHPGSFMLNWTAFCLEEFVDELKHWDGHVGKTSSTLFSTRKEDLEWFQTLGRLVGVGGSISKPYISGFGSTVYRLQQNNRKWATGASIKHTTQEVSDERVLCPTVPTGWFYVRRNGKIFVTGNTNYKGTPPTMSRHTKIPVAAIREFQARYFMAFPGIPRWHEHVAATLANDGNLVSLMGRRRWFFGRRGDDSTIREAIAFDPQGSVGDILNRGMLQVWRSRTAQLLLQIHDAILIQYPEEREDEIVPAALEQIKVPVELNGGRTLVIPSEAKTGFNWSNASEDNPDGLIKWTGHDGRTRQPLNKVSLMDRRF